MPTYAAEMWSWGAKEYGLALMIDPGDGQLIRSKFMDESPPFRHADATGKVVTDDSLVLAFVTNKLLDYQARLIPVGTRYDYVIEFATESDQALFKLTWM